MVFLCNISLSAQKNAYQKQLKGAIDKAELKPPKPVKPDLSLENKNCIEFTIAAVDSDKDESDFNIEGLNGYLFSAKYKKEIYKDEINRLSIGLVSQFLNLTYRDVKFVHSTTQNKTLNLRTNHEIVTAGVLVSNRFNKSIKIANLFLDLELSGLAKVFSKENTSFSENYSNENFSFPSTFSENLPILHELKSVNFTTYFTIQPGVEFTILKRVSIFLAYNVSRGINPLFKRISITPLLDVIEGQYINTDSFSIGFRF